MSNGDPVKVPFWRSLSGRLLLLTVLFVLIGEVLIFVPSIARFRMTYLQERVEAGHIATLALEAAPSGKLTPELETRLLDHAMVEAVVLRTPERSSFMLSKDMPPPIDATYDLRNATPRTLIMAAFDVLVDGPTKTIRVLDESRMAPGTVVEVVLVQRDLYYSMLDYSWRILTLSIVLSLLTASLVYVSLQWQMVRPMRAITDNLMRFRANPEDAASQIAETRRGDEIGAAQKSVREMQRDLRRALLQKTRLAALGAAMSKINHDLRNHPRHRGPGVRQSGQKRRSGGAKNHPPSDRRDRSRRRLVPAYSQLRPDRRARNRADKFVARQADYRSRRDPGDGR